MLVFSTKDSSMTKYLSVEGCKWIFNPPHSSYMGGAWERMIELSRWILDSMLPQISSSHLTHEMLSTLMADVCAIVNARPLASISTDPESPLLLSQAKENSGKECSIFPAYFGKGGGENTLHPFSPVRNGKTTNLISRKETWSFWKIIRLKGTNGQWLWSPKLSLTQMAKSENWNWKSLRVVLLKLSYDLLQSLFCFCLKLSCEYRN